MKHCNKCGETKEYTQFSKRKDRKDGLQDYCKTCNKVSNRKFRTEINPEHHAQWQRNNRKRANELIGKYRKADKTGIVYALINPIGDAYVGMTKTPLSVRMIEHKVKYRRYLNGKLLEGHPLLFNSFKKYGIENHKVKILFEDQTINRKDLKMMETTFIKAFKQNGKSLNVIL